MRLDRSDGQKRAWFEELRADFPNLPDEFIHTAVEAFDKEPALYNDLFRNERKRLARDAGLPADTGRLTIAQLEARDADFKVQLEAIQRDTVAFITKNVEDKEKTVDTC